MSAASKTDHFNQSESRFQGGYSKTVFNTISQAYRPFLWRSLFLIFLGILGRTSILANVNLTGLWVDSFCKDGIHCREMPSWISGWDSGHYIRTLIMLTVGGFLLSWIFRIGLSRISAHAISSVYDETTMRTSRLPIEFFDRNPAGRVITRFSSDYNNLFRLFGGPLPEFMSLVFDLFIMSALLVASSIWFLPIWIIFVTLNLTVYRLNLNSLRRERRDLIRKRSPSIAHFAETAQGASTVRAYGKTEVFFKRFKELTESYLNQRLRTQGYISRFAVQMGILTASIFLLTGGLSYYLVNQGKLTIGSVGVAFAYLTLSTTIIQSFFEWLAQFEEGMTGLERLDQYMRFPIETGAALPTASAFKTNHPLKTVTPGFVSKHVGGAAVSFDGVWFKYRENGPNILKGINLQIKAGERVAVVGRTGSGKSTLIQTLFRLYPLERGSIRVDGYEADLKYEAPEKRGLDKKVSLDEYRSLISLITQEPTLFAGTLRQNLTVQGTEDDAVLGDVLKRVQYLPANYTLAETKSALSWFIEEKGKNLSSGEKQLICMARCLLQNTPVIVMDEATSSVDPQSEEVLTRATEEFFKGKTQIIIAHRLSTIQSCDRVIWLNQGEIVMQGTPREVLPKFEARGH